MFTKKLTLFLLFILFHLQFSTALSQIIVSIERPPLNQITVQDLWKLTLNNPTKETFTAYFIGTVEEPSKGKIYEGTSSEFQLKPGINRIRISDLKITSDFYIQEYENIIMRTGIAPEGNYQICVNVLNTKNKVQIGIGCIVHTIIAQRHIDLISPINNEVINSGAQIIFRFTPILQPDNTPPTDIPRAVPYTPKPKKGVTYIIKIVELYPNQSPEDAMRKNLTFYENESGTPILIYPANAKKFESNKQYAWQVTAFFDGKEIAYSDVWTFTIAPHSKYISKIQLISPENNLIVNVSDPEGDWIDFKWNLPTAYKNDKTLFRLKIVELNNEQITSDAIKHNPVWFESDPVRDTTFRYSLKNKPLKENIKYAWQISAYLLSGEIFLSEIYSFTFAAGTSTATTCGWPTLINEFPVKSDETNQIIYLWGETDMSSGPVFVIPAFDADRVWGSARSCWNITWPWPPTSPTCRWHWELYDRGACWIIAPWGEWDSIPNPGGHPDSWIRAPRDFTHIIQKDFSIESQISNVRITIFCDDEVEIYFNPNPELPLHRFAQPEAFIATHRGYVEVGRISLPDLEAGSYKLVFKLLNIFAPNMGLIYGLDYDIVSEPPEDINLPPAIRVPTAERNNLCIGSDSYEFEIRAALIGGTIDRDCLSMKISSIESHEEIIYTTLSEPRLLVENLGEDPEGNPIRSIFIRLNAIDLVSSLFRESSNCYTINVMLRAGNIDCIDTTEASWQIILDFDNRPPEVSFILPPLTIPTTIPDYRLIIPLTEPRKYEKIEEPGGYCLNLPLPEQFQIDISWASGLDARDIVIEAKFQRKLPVPTEEDPNIFTFPEGDIIIEIDRSVLSFHIENTSRGYQLWMNSSIITAYLLERGITLQEGDLLTFSIVFSDNPCICERSNFQASYRFKICSF
jgi:hypothetical protein